MKKITKILALAMFMFAGLTMFNSCNDDPCKDVTCLNGGACDNGSCNCATGYSGSDCSTIVRNALVGTVAVSSNSCTPAGTTWTSSITAGTAISDFTISDFGHFTCGSGAIVVSASITSATAFTIPSQTVCGTTYSGTGTISGTSATVSYSWSDPTQTPSSGTCTETWTL